MAKDKVHDDCKLALIKDGWTITDDPYSLEVGTVSFRIDLGAEKMIAAVKGKEKIAVEIKSFSAEAFSTQFYLAIGQFFAYIDALEQKEPERVLYLALPQKIWVTFFQRPFYQDLIAKRNIKLIIFNDARQKIVQWIR